MSADGHIDPAAHVGASCYYVPCKCTAGRCWFDRWDDGEWYGMAFGGNNYLSLGFDGAPFLEGFACLVAWLAKAGIFKKCRFTYT